MKDCVKISHLERGILLGIYDTISKLIYNTIALDGNKIINVASFGKGVYFLKIVKETYKLLISK